MTDARVKNRAMTNARVGQLVRWLAALTTSTVLIAGCTKDLLVLVSTDEPDGGIAANPRPRALWTRRDGYAVAVGHTHSCALQSGTLYCWGGNEFGQLGKNPESEEDGAILPFPGPKNWIELALGVGHSCGLRSTGEVFCWGLNDEGQLGRSSQEETYNPDLVRFGESSDTDVADAIASGTNHVCARLVSGRVYCWGDNRSGQLGLDPSQTKSVSQPVRFGDREFKHVFAGSRYTCALTTVPTPDSQASELICAGENAQRQLGRIASAMSSGEGDAGTANLEPDYVPAAADGLRDDIRTAGAGRSHTCALTEHDVVTCWGDPEDGRLGYKPNSRTAAPTPDPMDVAVKAKVLALAVGPPGSCALTAESLVCWGDNRQGQLGLGEIEVAYRATEVDIDDTIVDMSIGPNHSCVLGIEGTLPTVYCAGKNDENQIGSDSEATENTFQPVPFAPL